MKPVTLTGTGSNELSLNIKLRSVRRAQTPPQGEEY